MSIHTTPYVILTDAAQVTRLIEALDSLSITRSRLAVLNGEVASILKHPHTAIGIWFVGRSMTQTPIASFGGASVENLAANRRPHEIIRTNGIAHFISCLRRPIDRS